MPETASLPYKWYDTPNIHLCSIDDFRALCRDMGVRDRARHRAQQQEPPDPHAAAARQPVRRAGGVHAEAGLRALSLAHSRGAKNDANWRSYEDARRS